MAPSWMQLLLVAVVALLIFGGRGRISSIMGDVAKGITSFRKGLREEDAEQACARFEGQRFKMCVSDVLAMNDLGVADHHEKL